MNSTQGQGQASASTAVKSSNDDKNEGGKDDAIFTEFLASLMDYTPTIPDELVEHYLGRSGFQCPDFRLWDKRLILAVEDLSKALHEYGVNVKHEEYFADSPSTEMDTASRDE